MLKFITNRKNIIAILLCAISTGIFAQTARRRGPIIRQIDHILIESGNPKALFSFFTDDLNLPPAWPLAGSKEYISGGVCAGNVNLEFFQYTEGNRRLGKAEARYFGLAFEPYPLSSALGELKASSIPFMPQEPQYSTLPDGSRGVSLTSVTLPSFSNPGFSIFLYEYNPAFLKVGVRRMQLGNRLMLNGGGPLGLRSVREIVISIENAKKGEAAWSRLLGKPYAAGLWHVGAGPAIRIIEGRGAAQIRTIVLEVRSLDRAKQFLRTKRLLSPDGSSLHPAKLQQLGIRLFESPKTDSSATQ
jgi:hypothetical protein